MHLYNLGCCGIKEIQGLRDWNEGRVFHMLQQNAGRFPCAWICINGVLSSGYVQTFRNFVQANNFGTLHDLPHLTNPNSNNVLDVSMLAVNHAGVADWYARVNKEQKGICNCDPCAYTRAYQVKMQEEQARIAPRVFVRSTGVGDQLRQAASSLIQRGIEQRGQPLPPASAAIDDILSYLERDINDSPVDVGRQLRHDIEHIDNHDAPL